MKKKAFLINSACKASEVVLNDPKIVRLLQTLGIPLGFGDMSIKQLCAMNNISEQLFVTLGNLLLYPDYMPDIERLDEEDALILVNYLESTHEYYKHISFPQLHENVHKIAERCNQETKVLVNCFFDEYDAEMNRHIDIEEHELFGYVKDLLHGREKKERSVREFLEQHSDVEVKINDFKNIIAKYVPSECNIPERYYAVIQMLHISEELRFHTMIEERILFPLAIRIEEKNRG